MTEGQIGKVKIKNRLVMLPMARQFQGFNGEVTQKTIDYFAQRARGGAGLIILGSTRVFPPGHPFFTPASLNLGDHRYLAGHSELVQTLRVYGAKVSIQFGHIGGQTSVPNVAASDVQQYFCDMTPYHKPRAITRDEIFDVIDRFGKGALLAKTAGYDMVEIHAAHNYLLGGFLSRQLNHRTDEFGGSLENRTRILVELIKQMKKEAGEDFPVCVRINATDYLEGCLDMDESVQIAQILEKAGADVISVSAGCHETQHLSNDIMRLEEGFKRPLFEAIKKAVHIPIIAAGGFRNPHVCEEIVASGTADFLGMGRSFIADPEWPKKAKEGRVEDIRRCLSCGECLYEYGGKFILPQGCTVNAAFSREGIWSDDHPAPVRKKVMVIGGGPGGMEAARIAAMRGHDVTVYEKESELGGQLNVAALPPGKGRILWLRSYLETQLHKLGVNIELGQEVTPQLLRDENPDAVIVATGSKPIIPDIEGLEPEKAISATDVLTKKVELKNKTVVVDRGALVGCEVAEYLLSQGNRVTIVEKRNMLAKTMEATNRRGLLDSLKAYGDQLEVLTESRVERLVSGGASVKSLVTGEERTIKADAVVWARGNQAVKGLAEFLDNEGYTFYTIGDCRHPATIKQAIFEGAFIGHQI